MPSAPAGWARRGGGLSGSAPGSGRPGAQEGRLGTAPGIGRSYTLREPRASASGVRRAKTASGHVEGPLGHGAGGTQKDVSYISDRRGHGCASRGSTVAGGLGSAGSAGSARDAQTLDFQVPRSKIPKGHHLVESWPVVPRDRGLHGIALHPEGRVIGQTDLSYDAARETWDYKVFPSRLPASRQDVLLLREWLAEESARFSQKVPHEERQDAFLFAKRAQALYGRAFHELTRQVTVHCEERGSLMADIWKAHMLVTTQALESLKQQGGNLEEELGDLRDQAESYEEDTQRDLMRLETEVEQLQEELAKAREVGEGGGAEKGSTGAGGKPGGKMGAPSVGGSGEGSQPTPQRGSAKRGSMIAPLKSDMGMGSPGSGLSPNSVRRSSQLMGTLNQPPPGGFPPGANRARRASFMTQSLQAQLQEKVAQLDQLHSTSTSLEEENERYREALNQASVDLEEMDKEILALEKDANQAVVWEGRAEFAENLVEELQTQKRAMTPRPRRDYGPPSHSLADTSKDALDKALQLVPHLPDKLIAEMLIGGKEEVNLKEKMEHFGSLAELISSSRGKISRESIQKAMEDGSINTMTDTLDSDTLSLVQVALHEGISSELLSAFLTGMDSTLREVPKNILGRLHGIDTTTVEEAILHARKPTTKRVHELEEKVELQDAELTLLRKKVQQFEENQRKREIARLRKQEEAKTKKQRPLDVVLAYWKTADDAEWKDNFQAIGTGNDVPKILRGLDKIRNRHMTKRDTEKLAKEVWKEKYVHDSKAKEKTLLDEYTYIHFQKKVGIPQAVVELGYNFIYSLQKYDYDADCEMFLKVFSGEVREEVYYEQIQLQAEIEDLSVSIDRGSGEENGKIAKSEFFAGLKSYFRVGHQGGKSHSRFEQLISALEKDQPDEEFVEYKKLFEEDREYNQGEFAETVRDQMLEERIEYFKDLEEALYDQTNFEETCTPRALENALCKLDPEMPLIDIKKTLDSCFPKGVQDSTVGSVLIVLKQGVGRKARKAGKTVGLSKSGGKKKLGKMLGAVSAMGSTGRARGVASRRSSLAKMGDHGAGGRRSSLGMPPVLDDPQFPAGKSG